VPLLVALLVRVNRTYEDEEHDLTDGLGKIRRPLPSHHIVVVLVDALDEKTLHALQYALTTGPQKIVPLHLSTDERASAELGLAWRRLGVRAELQIVPCEGRPRAECLGQRVRALAGDDVQITVVMPGPAR